MDKTTERVIHAMAFLFKYKGEVVIDFTNDECVLFINYENQFKLKQEEVDILINNEIIEKDGGSIDPEYETDIYKLTPDALYHIDQILNNKKQLLLK